MSPMDSAIQPGGRVSGLDADLTRLVRRQDEADRLAAQAVDWPAPTVASFVGTTVSTGTYPTDVGVMYMVQPAVPQAPETEGSVVALASTGPAVACLHAGNNPPPLGAVVLVSRLLGGRWGFPYG